MFARERMVIGVETPLLYTFWAACATVGLPSLVPWQSTR
jgi:hypothetical protein